MPLRIPKLRQGTYFPSLLEPRKRSEEALLAVIQQAYVLGVSTRKVDELVQALGLSGVDKSKVSRICKELDELVEAFRQRPLTEAYPYVWLDALFLKVRQHRRVVSQAVVIAVLQLVGALLAEADDEWQVSRRYFSKDSMRQLYEPDLDEVTEPTPLKLAPVR